MTNTPNANICLTFDADLSENLIRYAQTLFGSTAQGYCLERNVFPHITLTQIHYETVAQKNFLNRQLEELSQKKYEIKLSGFHARFASPYLWCEFIVERDKNLLTLQSNIDALVRKNGLIPLNPTLDQYHPHVTLARIGESDVFPSFNIPKIFMDKKFISRIALGPSDDNGQLLGLMIDD